MQELSCRFVKYECGEMRAARMGSTLKRLNFGIWKFYEGMRHGWSKGTG